jgi:hypothetical protein
MKWYENTLTKYRKELIQAGSASFVISLAYLLCMHFLGHSFVWKNISPIDQPSILVRVFYSALVFILPGRWLLDAGFYKTLYDVIARKLGMKWLYDPSKYVLWTSMIVLMYFVVKYIVDVINAVISFFYNIFNLILYLSPSIGVFLVLSIMGTYGLIRLKKVKI